MTKQGKGSQACGEQCLSLASCLVLDCSGAEPRQGDHSNGRGHRQERWVSDGQRGCAKHPEQCASREQQWRRAKLMGPLPTVAGLAGGLEQPDAWAIRAAP
jgi:hypothetical protein